MDVGKYVSRRLHQVRVAVSLLNHEMDRGNKGSKECTIARPTLDSIVSTVEMFLEDCDRVLQRQSGGEGAPDNKKFVETAKQTVKV